MLTFDIVKVAFDATYTSSLVVDTPPAEVLFVASLTQVFAGRLAPSLYQTAPPSIVTSEISALPLVTLIMQPVVIELWRFKIAPPYWPLLTGSTDKFESFPISVLEEIGVMAYKTGFL